MSIVGTHCLLPPLPPEENNLRIQGWDGHPIPIGDVSITLNKLHMVESGAVSS